MRIKNRFIISFGIFVVMVISLAASNLAMNFTLKNLLDRSIEYARILSFWRELDFAFKRQQRTLDYYLMFSSPAERESFTTQSSLVEKKINEFMEKNSRIIESNSTTEINTWKEKYSAYTAAVGKILATAGAPPEGQIKFFEQKIEPLLKQLSDDIASRISFYSDRIDSIQSDISVRTSRSIIFAMASGIAAFLLAVYLSISLFRTISNPLRLLEQGAEIIGRGELSHRIILKKAPPELKTLADNFNSMVENLSKLQLQVVQMDRMSSIGQLSGGVAHEINNPLTGVLGQAQLLLEKLPEDSPYRPHIVKIENAAQRCRRIVRSLLDFSRDKDYNFIPTDVNQIIEETLELISSELQTKNIVVSKKFSQLPRITASPSHLHQVFLNIMTNAIQAMKNSGGTLTVETGFYDSNSVEISIKDTGTGIRKEHLNHIFDPFFTTKDIGQGTGLGLTICYGIIQKHNGTIQALSEGENKGAQIIVRLPIKREAGA